MPPPQGTPNPLEGPADYTFTSKVHSDTYPEISPTQWNLSGKSVFIAGASKGAGRATAVSFTRAGASHIAIGARSSLDDTAAAMLSAAKAANRPEPTILPVKLDIASPESTAQAAEKISRAFAGKLDILVVCAGAISMFATIADSDPHAWIQDIQTNLVGPYLVTKACLPLIKQSEQKTIVVLASVGGHLSSPGLSAYKMSKLGVIRLMEFVCSENPDVVAMSIHPGNMLTEIVGHGEGMREDLVPAFVDTPELAADGVVFLAKERREWLRGRYVNITWDLPEVVGEKKRGEIVRGDLLKVRLAV